VPRIGDPFAAVDNRRHFLASIPAAAAFVSNRNLRNAPVGPCSPSISARSALNWDAGHVDTTAVGFRPRCRAVGRRPALEGRERTVTPAVEPNADLLVEDGSGGRQLDRDHDQQQERRQENQQAGGNRDVKGSDAHFATGPDLHRLEKIELEGDRRPAVDVARDGDPLRERDGRGNGAGGSARVDFRERRALRGRLPNAVRIGHMRRPRRRRGEDSDGGGGSFVKSLGDRRGGCGTRLQVRQGDATTPSGCGTAPDREMREPDDTGRHLHLPRPRSDRQVHAAPFVH
jgi:hypothetical protein